MAKMPGDFITGVQRTILINIQQLPDPTDRLRDEINALTGTRDDTKFLPLTLSIANIAYFCKSDAAGTIITCLFVGLG